MFLRPVRSHCKTNIWLQLTRFTCRRISRHLSRSETQGYHPLLAQRIHETRGVTCISNRKSINPITKQQDISKAGKKWDEKKEKKKKRIVITRHKNFTRKTLNLHCFTELAALTISFTNCSIVLISKGNQTDKPVGPRDLGMRFLLEKKYFFFFKTLLPGLLRKNYKHFHFFSHIFHVFITFKGFIVKETSYLKRYTYTVWFSLKRRFSHGYANKKKTLLIRIIDIKTLFPVLLWRSISLKTMDLF